MAVDPFRLRVLKAICARLKTIGIETGYSEDMADSIDDDGLPVEKVFRGRTEYGDNDPLPMLSVLENPAALENGNYDPSGGKGMYAFRILIQGFVKDDKDHPLDPAYHLSAQVTKALVSAKKDRYNILGTGPKLPCITALVVDQPIHRPADNEVSDVAFFLIGVTLTLAEDPENPYA